MPCPPPTPPSIDPGRQSVVQPSIERRAILAVVFMAAAVPKLANAHSFAHMFAQICAGYWLQYLVGTAELLGAIALLVSPFTGLATAKLCLGMTGGGVINAHHPAQCLGRDHCRAGRPSGHAGSPPLGPGPAMEPGRVALRLALPDVPATYSNNEEGQ